MNLSRTTDHGPPTEHPETGYRVCRKCHERYRWSSETGEYDREPYGACSGLKRGSLERGKGVNQRNPERMERRRYSEGLKVVYGPYWEWASGEPCVVCGTVDGVPADHWQTVKTGEVDAANCIAVCADHNDRHSLGVDTWQERYDVDAEAACERLWRRFHRRRPKLAKRIEEATGVAV